MTGELPSGFTTLYTERLSLQAFVEAPVGLQTNEEREGWVHLRNFCELSFTSEDDWFADPYAYFALRIDKKRVPRKIVRARTKVACDKWAEEHGVARVPATVKSEIRDSIENEILRRVQPSVQTVGCIWNVRTGDLIADTRVEARLDRFRKLFHRTFGMRAVPWSPLCWTDEQTNEAMLSTAPTMVQLDPKETA